VPPACRARCALVTQPCKLCIGGDSEIWRRPRFGLEGGASKCCSHRHRTT
jgi:hypothetical protein